MTLNSVTHHSALLYSVHGYAWVHPSISIYIPGQRGSGTSEASGTSRHSAARAYIRAWNARGATSIYIYIYTNLLTAGFVSLGSLGNFASLGGPHLLGGGDAHGMRTGAD